MVVSGSAVGGADFPEGDWSIEAAPPMRKMRV